jgi:peroxiredoxin
MKRILILSVLLILIAGCNNKNKISIEGIVKGKTAGYIYLNRVDVDKPVFIDSIKINKKGHFSTKIEATEPDFYQLGFSTSDFITLLALPQEKISLQFDGKNLFENYSVSGSEGSEKLRVLDLALAATKVKLDSLISVYKKNSTLPGFESKGKELEAEYTRIIKEQRKSNIGFIINNLSSLAAIKALYQKIDAETYVLYDPRDLQYMKIATDTLKHYYPESRHVKALATDFEKEMNQMYTNQLEQLAKDLPQTKLDPNLADVNGKRIALSSLKGKYVLLTFWSMQSRTCIEENLQFKEIYRLYNKKGFEIYQINLDENAESWKAAVKFDELPWISTREDDALNPVNAVLFNVKALPTNYLFNKEGEIVGSNLHGRALNLKLQQLFN